MTQEFLPPLQSIKPAKKPQKRRNAKGLFAGKVDLEKDYKRIHTVLSREIAYLMMASHTRPLEEHESKALVAYCKLVRDLREQKLEEKEVFSEADLVKRAAEVKPKIE